MKCANCNRKIKGLTITVIDPATRRKIVYCTSCEQAAERRRIPSAENLPWQQSKGER